MMRTDVDTCLRHIADWYVNNRREIKHSELHPILLKHCESETEVEKVLSFLETDPGQLRFKTLLREEYHLKLGPQIVGAPTIERKPSYLKETELEIEEVLASDFIEELKTGAWKKQLNRLSTGKYEVEVYWEPWISEAPRVERWEKTLDTEGEAAKVYESLDSMRKVKSMMPREASYLRQAEVADTECQIISPKYYDILTWLNVPVPDYSFAIEPEIKERKIDEVLQKLKDGVASIHESAIFREFLITISKFHDYSIGNQILIMIQRSGATRVAGIKTWNELGRYIKRGEHGIAILAPCLPPKVLKCPICDRTFTEAGLRTHLSEFHKRVDVPELIKLAKEEAVVTTPTYFKVVYVFDVAQTEGKELPEVAVPVLTGAYSEDLFNKLMKLSSRYSLTVSFGTKPGLDPQIKGMLVGKDIWVRPEEAPAQRLKTLAHETAHYFTESVYFIPRAEAEVIAESVAFVVCAHSGFDTGIRSFPYVALWAKEKKVLEQNLASVRKISSRMIEELG